MFAKLPFITLFALMLAGSAMAKVADDCKKFPEVVAADDVDHYCNFVYQETFDRCSWAGAIALAVCVILSAIVVLLRDVMKVFDCCGVTKGSTLQAPLRSLTTMSAAYAPNTHATD